jgi:crossover junction endodeoxyribonuclease RusA
LPYPPTINTYWRKFRDHMVISKKGRAFRTAVCLALMRAGIRPLEGDLTVKIRLYPPDRRKRDIDNIQKPLLDALEKGHAYLDDSQVAVLITKRCEIVRGGQTVVTIRKMKRSYENSL